MLVLPPHLSLLGRTRPFTISDFLCPPRRAPEVAGGVTPPTIDHTAYPAIVHTILSHASHDVLLAFRKTSHFWQRKVDELMFRHIVVQRSPSTGTLELVSTRGRLPGMQFLDPSVTELEKTVWRRRVAAYSHIVSSDFCYTNDGRKAKTEQQRLLRAVLSTPVARRYGGGDLVTRGTKLVNFARRTDTGWTWGNRINGFLAQHMAKTWVCNIPYDLDVGVTAGVHERVTHSPEGCHFVYVFTPEKALRKHSSTLRQPDGYLGILAPAIESIRRSRTIYPRSRQQLTLVGIEGIPVHLMGLHTGTTYEEALVHIRNAIRSRSPSKPKNTFMAIGFQTLDERRATLGVEEFLLETEYLQCWERAT